MNNQFAWKYYNNALIPTTSPFEAANVSELSQKEIWRKNPKALLARWTSDYDCGYETNWWYVIKDTPFELSELKAKRRYEITKGVRNFDVQIIEPQKYAEEIFCITKAAYSAWPAKYRPFVEKEEFVQSIKNWNNYEIYGAFSKSSGVLCAYGMLLRHDKWVDFCVLRADPAYEKLAINAAMVFRILENHKAFLQSGGCICDGARSINHETAFQDYLEKYFGFRKAYCMLHIQFRPIIRVASEILYLFKAQLEKFDNIGIVHKINSVMKMREYAEE